MGGCGDPLSPRSAAEGDGLLPGNQRTDPVPDLRTSPGPRGHYQTMELLQWPLPIHVWGMHSRNFYSTHSFTNTVKPVLRGHLSGCLNCIFCKPNYTFNVEMYLWWGSLYLTCRFIYSFWPFITTLYWIWFYVNSLISWCSDSCIFTVGMSELNFLWAHLYFTIQNACWVSSHDRPHCDGLF